MIGNLKYINWSSEMQQTKMKKTYSTPSLQLLGAVKDLTASGSVSNHHPMHKRKRKHRHHSHRR